MPDSIVHSLSSPSSDARNQEIDGGPTARTSSPVAQSARGAENGTYGDDGAGLPRQPEDSSHSVNAGLEHLSPETNFQLPILFSPEAPSFPIHSNPSTTPFGGGAFVHQGSRNAPRVDLSSDVPNAFMTVFSVGGPSSPPSAFHHHRSTAPRRGVLNPGNTGDALAPSGVALDYGNAIRSGNQPPHALFAPMPLPSGSGAPRLAAHANYFDAATPPLPGSATPFTSMRGAEVAARIVDGGVHRFEQAWWMVRTLPDDEFDVLLQEMHLLAQERATMRDGVAGTVRPSYSQASTFSQIGGVAGRYGEWTISDSQPSFASPQFNNATAASGLASTSSMTSTSAAAASPPLVVCLYCGCEHDTHEHCGNEHDAHQSTYMSLYDTNMSPFPQGIVGPYSHPPQGQLVGHGQHPIFEGSPSGPSSQSSINPLETGGKCCSKCRRTETKQWRTNRRFCRPNQSPRTLCHKCWSVMYYQAKNRKPKKK